MSTLLLHCDKYPLQVLLQKIKINGISDPNLPSKQRPVAKLIDYYNVVEQNKGLTDTPYLKVKNEDKSLEIGPIIHKVDDNHWIDFRDNPAVVKQGYPSAIEQYPKCLNCQIVVFIGQNACVVAINTIAVVREPVFIVRRNGSIGTLDSGFQTIDFGSGFHFVLLAFGATVVIPGNGDINENKIIYTCIRPQFLGLSSQDPLLYQPMLFVFTAQKFDFYLVQVKQSLAVICGKTFKVQMSDNFWFLEFNTLFSLFPNIINRKLGFARNDRQKQVELPKDVIIPNHKLSLLGPIIKNLVISESVNTNMSINGIEYTFEPKKGRILVFANFDEMASSGVVDKCLVLRFKGNINAIIMTTEATNIIIGPNDNIRRLTSHELHLNNTNHQYDRNHVILMFRKGFLLMTGCHQ